MTASSLPFQKAGEEALSEPSCFFQTTLPVSLLRAMKTPSLSIRYIRLPAITGANSINSFWSYFQSFRNGGPDLCTPRNFVRAWS